LLQLKPPTPTPSKFSTPAPVQSPTPDPAPALQYSQRIVCGRTTPYQDTRGNNWVVSSPYIVGGASSYSTNNAIEGTIDDPIYQKQNWKNTDLAFQIPVNVGVYNVVLHFAEPLFNEPSKRVFSISVEGQQVRSSLDIYQAVGGKLTAHTVETQIEVLDGIWNIVLGKNNENPCISGIDAVSLASPVSPSPIPIPVPVTTPMAAPIEVPTPSPVNTPTEAAVKSPTPAPVPASVFSLRIVW
jgi:Malectin domain